MAWVAVDKSTVECIFGNKPKRKVGHWEDEEPRELVLK